jgi:hypothetical protein
MKPYYGPLKGTAFYSFSYLRNLGIKYGLCLKSTSFLESDPKTSYLSDSFFFKLEISLLSVLLNLNDLLLAFYSLI